MKRSTVILTLTLLLAFTGVTANASLIGDNVIVDATVSGVDTQARGTFGNFAGVVEAVVGGPEVTFTAFDQGTGFEDIDVAIDIGAEDVWMTLTVNSSQSSTLASLSVTGMDWVGMPTGELLDIQVNSSNAPGFNLTGFGSNAGGFAVTFNSTGTQIVEPGEYSFHIHLITDHPGSAPIIPEPATMTLMGLGFAGLALRRKKSA